MEAMSITLILVQAESSCLYCSSFMYDVLKSNSNQYPVSFASLSAICNLAIKSAFPCAYCASLMLAPIDVPLLPIWLEMIDYFLLFKSLTRLIIEIEKSID